MKNFQSLPDALNDLKGRGYLADFGTDKVCLYHGEFDIRLDPDEFNIDAVYHFDEVTKAQEEPTVLFAITSTTGVKGTLIDNDGSYAAHLNLKTTHLQHVSSIY